MDANSILIRSRPRESVLDYGREQLAGRLRQILIKKGVEEAYLFGSLLTDEATAWSDIDMVIVCDAVAPFPERARAFFELYDLGLPLDILVYRPEEFAALRSGNSGFWRTFAKNHLRIV